MFDDTTYDSDYKDKLKLFAELLESRLGKATEQSQLRLKLSRIALKGNAVNNVLLSEQKQEMENVCVVSVRQDATINQLYVGLDDIELILSDSTLQTEFFEKIQGLSSNVYTVREKQVDSIGLLIRFIK